MSEASCVISFRQRLGLRAVVGLHWWCSGLPITDVQLL